MENFKFTQTGAEMQAIIDKAAALPEPEELAALIAKLNALPTKAELDDMLFCKVDKKFSFGVAQTPDSGNVLTFTDGTDTWIVGNIDADSGVFVHDTIYLGTGYGYDIISQRNGGWPWNAAGCKEAEVGKVLNVPIDYLTFKNTDISDITGEYGTVSGFTIGEQVACAEYMTPGEMICNVKWNGHVIPGWYALIFAGSGTSVYIFENKA